MEIFNLFNHANFADPSGGINADSFGGSLNRTAFFGQSISTVGNQLGGLLGAGGPRQIQLSVRCSIPAQNCAIFVIRARITLRRPRACDNSEIAHETF